MEGLVFNIQKFSLHDGSGIRTNVFLQGCNLRCRWCANPESIELAPDPAQSAARLYSVDELVAELLKDKPFYDTSGGGVTLTGGEPLLQHEFVFQLCDALHAAGVNVALETAANIKPEIFAQALKHFDTVHIDLKHYDEQKHRAGTGVGNTQTIANLRTALGSATHTIIRIPVIPGFNDTPGDMAGFAKILAGPPPAKEVHLLPFHQMGESKYEKAGKPYAYAGVPQLHEEDLKPLAEVLQQAGFEVQIGG